MTVVVAAEAAAATDSEVTSGVRDGDLQIKSDFETKIDEKNLKLADDTIRSFFVEIFST